MAYSDVYGNRPPELASKSSHSQIIKDQDVNAYLSDCQLPKYSEEIDDNDLAQKIFDLNYTDSQINYVLAIDCGYTRSIARKGFPSSEIAHLRFGALLLDLNNLDRISKQPFTSPKEMAKLKQAKTWNLILPIAGIKYKDEASLLNSIRITLHEFFTRRLNTDSPDTLLHTLKWLLYQEYEGRQESVRLNDCPNPSCKAKDIPLHFDAEQHLCPACSERLFLIDFFRLHEIIDEDQGAAGILTYVSSLIEQLLIAHYMRLFMTHNPTNLRQVLFLRDGPLAFFGQPAILHKYVRDMLNSVRSRYPIFLAGLEKSGAFVEHALEICKKPHAKIAKSQFLLLDNNYIYKYIVAGKPNDSQPYGSSTYYGSKIIFRDSNDKIHVITIPVINQNAILSPAPSHFDNLAVILTIIDKLKCDMYDNALLPVTLVNKAVSLANRPSAIILEKFAKYKISK